MNYLATVVFLFFLSLNLHSATNVVTNTGNAGAGSLREQISEANNGDTIRFSSTLLTGGSNSIVLSTKIIFSTNLTIVGLYNSTDTLYISGGNNTGIFRIDNANKVYFDSIAIVNGLSDWGGAIRFNNSDSLFVHNSILRNNTAIQSGGAIHGANFLSLENTIVTNNSATFSGGGIHSNEVYINNSTITYNLAENTYGGGVYAHGTALVNNSIINNNQAEERGGGIYVWNSNCNVNNSTISNNTVVDNGGGIYSTWVFLDNSTVSNNTANYGGGIDFIQLLVADNNTSITNNTAAIDGGGIFTELSTDSIIVNNSTIDYNTANGKGGGIYAYESSGSLSSTWIKVNNSSISNNTASWGGGIHTEAYFSARFLIVIDNSTLNNNSSTTNAGGGIYSFASVTPSWVNVNNSTISYNQAYSGGGIYSAGSSSIITIKTSTISNNIADVVGGGIYSTSSGYNNTDIENSTVYANTAATSGSGIYAGTLNLKGSILFNPGGTTGMEYSSLNSLGYNIFNDVTLPGSHITDSLNINSTQLNLGPLQNNGGTTDTHLPLFNSVALNTGDPADHTAAQNSLVSDTRERGSAEKNCNSNALNEVISCENYTWLQNGQTYLNDTIVTDTIFNGNEYGCDSIVTLSLEIKNASSSTSSIVACDSYMWPHNGQIYVADTIITDTIFNGNVYGCDSIVTLSLEIKNASSSTSSIVACDSYMWPHNGQIYVADTIITDTIFNGNEYGCDSIIIFNLTINNVNSAITQVGGLLTADQSGATYQWLDCPAMTTISGATNQSFTSTTNGDYAVVITYNGCTDTSACYTITSVGIIENDFDNELVIYPNPTDGNFSIDLRENYQTVKLTITDLSGKRILSNDYHDSKLLNLEIEEPAGVYFLIIESGNKKAVIQLIKK